MPAADAIATLRAAGHCVTRTTRADAARRYGCQTALYVIDGRGVNLGRLRELATLAQAEPAPAPVAEPAAQAEPAAPEGGRPVLTLQPGLTDGPYLAGDGISLWAFETEALARRAALALAADGAEPYLAGPGPFGPVALPLAAAVAEPAAPTPEPVAEPAPLSPAGVVALLCRKFPVSTPATYQPAVARLQARGAAVNPVSVLRELNRPVLPGELTPPPAPVPHGAAAPVLPTLPRVAPPAPAPARPAPTGEGLAGLPWDPGTPAARAAVALQGERVGILWPIAQALRGEGVALPPSWASDGPVMTGELPLSDALARLPLGAIAQAAAALAALPPVTAAQDAALALCDTGAVPGRPYL